MKSRWTTWPWAAIACIGSLAAVIGTAQAQTRDDAASYPTRPVRFLTPAAPGGTTDILARLFSERLTQEWKQPFIVDNRASASGVLAAEATANAAPDGHTLFLAYHQHTINAALLPKLPYHPVNSFTPITQLIEAGLLLVVHPNLPASNFKELLAYGKTLKGGLNFGSAGIGSGGHLAGELMKLMTGVQATHVPYKGTGPAMAALLGQEYHFNFAGIAAASRLASAGKLKPLAVSSLKRSPALPDVPTVAESGLPGFEVVGWYGVVAPAKLPKPILTKLHTEFVKFLHEPKMEKTILDLGGVPTSNSPDEFRKFMLADMEKWRKVVQASGAKAY